MKANHMPLGGRYSILLAMTAHATLPSYLFLVYHMQQKQRTTALVLTT